MIINNPKQINTFRLLTLRAGLKLEMRGMKRRGISCYKMIKDEFNLKGSKQKVYEQLNDIINGGIK